MKKLFALTFALVLALSLAACKDGSGTITDNTSNPPASTAGSSTPESGTTSNSMPAGDDNSQADTSTVAGFLAQYGLTEADIEPDNFASYELTTDNYGGEIRISTSAAATLDQKKAWGDQILAKLIEISTDGKLYKGTDEFDTNITWANDTLLQFSFPYKGNSVIVTLNCGFGITPAAYSVSFTS